MTSSERAGIVATTLATVAVGWMAFASAQSAVIAGSGAYLLVLGPLVGFAITAGIYRALRAVCTTGSRRAEALALLGIASLPFIAFFGVSFGGTQVIPAGILLAIAAAITPRPAR